MAAPVDVLVVGGGHAGCEAAAAACRLGASVGLVSASLDTIARMSCNPAIGGVAKGQVVREIDALGGLMARAADATGIHFRLLGRSKGPAMWSPRAQCDKAAYAAWMTHAVQSLPGIRPTQGDVVGLLVDGRTVRGVRLRDGRELRAGQTVLTTGTFLGGLLHQGPTQTAGGRMGEGPGQGVSDDLAGLGLRLARMKTGTPPRLHADTIDWAACEVQPGDERPLPFSFSAAKPRWGNAVPCHVCHTTPAAHDAIRANLDRAPMFNGQVTSIGPRYCPSIEDKVVRFADRDRHQLFLEPEGLQTREVYVNGLATSLPIEVQEQVLAAIPALARAHVTRYGYAVEYDVVLPDQLDHRLAARNLDGLFLAGQINGTSGYEEAAGQGLVAGANAALAVAGREPLRLSRSDAYIGVMIDDLVHSQLDEPYRLFTSRAEHRLHLRADNADRRLAAVAARCGLIDESRATAVAAKGEAIAALVAAVPPHLATRIAGEGLDLASSGELAPALAQAEPVIAEGAWIELRYAAYLARQADRRARLERMRDTALPAGLDWTTVPGLSNEGRSRLGRAQPTTLGEAEAVPGVTAGDIETLWAWLQSRQRQRA